MRGLLRVARAAKERLYFAAYRHCRARLRDAIHAFVREAADADGSYMPRYGTLFIRDDTLFIMMMLLTRI